jgi:hypothetical protein
MAAGKRAHGQHLKGAKKNGGAAGHKTSRLLRLGLLQQAID